MYATKRQRHAEKPFAMPTDVFDALRRVKTVYLTTWSASGKASAVPIWFFEYSGRIYFCSQRDTLKVRRIRRSGRAALRLTRSGLHLPCAARIMDHDPDLQQRLLRIYRRRYRFRWLFLGPRIKRGFQRDEEVLIELLPDAAPA